MKLLYKIVIILAVLQFAILFVNSLDVFPKESQFYSDSEIDSDIRNADDAWDVTKVLLSPGTNTFLDDLSIAALGGLILVSSVIAWKVHSYTIVAFVFLIYVFYAMFARSLKFMEKMFYNWDNNSLIYLGLCFGLVIFTIFIITLAETPTHGRSG